MKYVSFLIFTLLLTSNLLAQNSLEYYLPQGQQYDKQIPTPKSVLGYEIGDWHISHDQLLNYMHKLAAASDRVKLVEYARSYEQRPLVFLVISSPENLARIDEIRQQHYDLTQPEKSAQLDIDNMPVVVYQGYTVHGNEPSGANAAPIQAYHLAAAQGNDVVDMLKSTVILLDPVMNPDGMNRFASWVNTHKSKTLDPDPASREHNEAWPSGRTNHYWFDLNRDWLLVQHPESQGRIKQFHRWKPNILTDHHEMGTNATYFFQPGIPSRTHPLTPQKNQDLTGQIAEYHAKELDKIGSLYYSKESFDDYYYGKGSTFPDINGSVGILFEQASSRGHLQNSIHGPLSFPFTIKNQFATSISTINAAKEMRVELLDFQRRFFKDAAQEASRDKAKAYIVGDKGDPARLRDFVQLLRKHEIKVYETKKDQNVGNQKFTKEGSVIVPFNQYQYRLIKAIFDTRTSFKDSLFYDVSGFTLPLAFNLAYAELTGGFSLEKEKSFGTKGKLHGDDKAYAYILAWNDYYSPKSLQKILAAGYIAKVANKPFRAKTSQGERDFKRGSIMIPATQYNQSPAAIFKKLKTICEADGTTIFAVTSGLTTEGMDLGSSNFSKLKAPKVLIVGGAGVTSYDAGECWHLLDTRYNIVSTIIDASRLHRADLNRYNTIVLPDGGYYTVTTSGKNNLKKWLANGGNLIAIRGGARWAAKNDLAEVSYKAKDTGDDAVKVRRPYSHYDNDSGAQYIGGAIFEVDIDNTHPICYGYTGSNMPVFHRGTSFMEWTKNQYAMPLRYTLDPLLCGYISSKNNEKISNSAGIICSQNGKGRVISMAMNPNFRAFWYGTNKLFANAIFFGPTLKSGTLEKLAPKETK